MVHLELLRGQRLLRYRGEIHGRTGKEGRGLTFGKATDSKESTYNVGDGGRRLGFEVPLEKGMATHSSILAWEIPRTEEPGGLQPMGLQRVRHD